MKILVTMAPSLEKALKVGAVLQLIVGILVVLKFEENGRERIMCFISVAPYWLLIGIIILLRRNAPTRLDLLIARFGFLFLFVLSLLLVPVIWKVKGY